MQSVYFFVQMDSEVGLPEFFLEAPIVGRHHIDGDHYYTVDSVRESLQCMLQQLSFFAASENETEYDLDVFENELVFWELEPEDDCYETTSAERVATTIAEVEYQLEVLPELEAELEAGLTSVIIFRSPRSSLTDSTDSGWQSSSWKEDGF